MARTDGADADGAADEALQEEQDRIDREQAFTEAFLTRRGEPGAEILKLAFRNGWHVEPRTDRSDWEWTGAASGWEIDLTSRTIWIDAEDTGWFYNEYLDPAAMADALWAALTATDDEGRPLVRAPMLRRGDTLQAGDYPRTTGEDGVQAFSSAMGMTRDGFWHVRKELTLSLVLLGTGVGMTRAAGGADDLIGASRDVAAAKKATAAADAAKYPLLKLPRYDKAKPSYHINPAHLPGPTFNKSKTPLPDDAEEVFRRAVPDNPENARHWYGLTDDGEIYKFHNANDGTAHFSARGNFGDGVRGITPYARGRLNELRD